MKQYITSTGISEKDKGTHARVTSSISEKPNFDRFLKSDEKEKPTIDINSYSSNKVESTSKYIV